MSAVARDIADDGDAAPAVADSYVSAGFANEAAAVLKAVRGHCSCCVQAYDSGTFGITERGAKLGRTGQIDCQRMAIAEEIALEIVGTCSHHLSGAHISSKPHIDTAGPIGRFCGKRLIGGIAVDDVRVSRCAATRK